MIRVRLSVSSRFMLVLAIGFSLQACISVISLINLRQALIQARTEEVKHLLETAYSTVAFYHDQASKGLMSNEAAQKAAKDAIRAMRYDGNNYFFIWTLNGVGVSHGSHPEWEGKNLLTSPYKDKLPVVSYMVARLTEVCKSSAKEGVTTYRIMKLGQTKPIDKIAYTKLFEPWGWSIGTGAYVDDIDATFRSKTLSLLVVFTGLILVASVVSFILGRNLANALRRLSARISSVAKGELDGEVPEIERADEVGVMARALLVLRDTSREAVELRLDQLTGLPNRKQLMDRLKHAIAATSRSGHYGGLILIDIDKFKALNDTHGHDAGDMLLREVAQRLTMCTRQGDTVARLGGDEFVVVLEDAGTREKEAATIIEAIAGKMLVTLSQPYQLGNIAYSSSGSIGLTMFKGMAATAEELLKQADLAMYKSKENGRNACRFFDPYMEATVRKRAAMEADMQLAIVGSEFRLHFQPQVGAGGRIEGAEALIRWNHPLRGMVMPGEFIPLAEETGLILPLGQWVLETACEQLAIWAEYPETADLRLSVNVSPRQFQQPEFVQQLLSTLERTGANPYRLELELTESLLVDNVDEIIEEMTALQAKGVGFSLDDFGTGYSSLYYLKRMPLNQLKIDRSFVRDVMEDPNDAAIAKTIVALAHALGLGVIAEGVETAEQRDFLFQSGCDSYQGYYFSRPLSLEDYEKFVGLSVEQ